MTGATHFKVSSQGDIQLPSADSLEEVAGIEENRNTALRAQSLLDAAMNLQHAAEIYDNSEKDVNSTEGTAVLPDLQLGDAGFENGPLVESEIWQIGEFGYDLIESKGFALGAKDGNFEAVARGYGYQSRTPSLTGSKTENGYKFVLDEPFTGNVEALDWNVASGEIAYKKLKTKIKPKRY